MAEELKDNKCRVILHCADTPDNDQDTFGEADIDKWHKARGWKSCGYHWVIRRTGVVEPGRAETEIGAHVEGYNRDSIGICYIGRHLPTKSQLNALKRLFLDIKGRWNIGSDAWCGHYEFNSSKECPGISMDLVRDWLGYVERQQ